MTVEIIPLNLIKTAFLQVKASDSYAATIEREQFEAASKVRMVYERAFILVVNKSNRDVRVGKLADYAPALSVAGTTKRVHSHRWPTLQRWIEGWLACEYGPPSSPLDLAGPEALLDRYAAGGVPYAGFEHQDLPPDVSALFSDVPDDFLPAEAWMRNLVDLGSR